MDLRNASDCWNKAHDFKTFCEIAFPYTATELFQTSPFDFGNFITERLPDTNRERQEFTYQSDENIRHSNDRLYRACTHDYRECAPASNDDEPDYSVVNHQTHQGSEENQTARVLVRAKIKLIKTVLRAYLKKKRIKTEIR